jgi:arginyl-tRNA synthetase
LDTKFDDQIFESEMAPMGLEIVRAYLAKEVFEESKGAVVFKGENYGLHTRVFINSHGLPTYEAKEIGLNTTKFKKYPDTTESIIVTASEQNDYFKVLIKALGLIDENIGNKTKHIGHGMLRFASGKMSSRTGKVITAEELLADTKKLVAGKMVGREFSEKEVEEISNTVAVAAIKYSILRSSIGGDVIYDQSKSISFEGDSGPYLQYSAVRAGSIIEKARSEGVPSEPVLYALQTSPPSPTIALADDKENMSARSSFLGDESGVGQAPVLVASEEGSGNEFAMHTGTADAILTRLILRFPEIIERAKREYAPQHVANYLINLAGAFNSFYASQTIVDKNDTKSPYYVALTKAFQTTITNGLWVLGIKVPKKM